MIRRWGIISFIALAYLAVALGYQAFLMDYPPSLGAQTATAKESEPPLPGLPENSPAPSQKQADTKNRHWILESQPSLPETSGNEGSITTPLIPVPVQQTPPALLPGALMEATGIPGVPSLPKTTNLSVFPNQSIIPVAAQEQPVKLSPMDLMPPPVTPTPSVPLPKASVPDGKTQPLPVPNGTKPAPMPPATFPWNLNVEIIDGRTHLAAISGKDVKFTITCDKLDLETPGGSIHAAGKVKLATDSIEGSCDRLTITWQEDVVVLEKVQLKCKLEGHEADLVAEQLRVRLSRVVTVGKRDATVSFWFGVFH